jgi:hypothetical protein
MLLSVTESRQPKCFCKGLDVANEMAKSDKVVSDDVCTPIKDC